MIDRFLHLTLAGRMGNTDRSWHVLPESIVAVAAALTAVPDDLDPVEGGYRAAAVQNYLTAYPDAGADVYLLGCADRVIPVCESAAQVANSADELLAARFNEEKAA